MNVWAIADLHLSIGVPSKNMDVFGPVWANYMEHMAENWRAVVQPEDLVLLPGDISWAMKFDEVVKDFEWIEALPGTKVMIRGNHDYWWSSPSKVRAHLPPSLHIIQNDVFDFYGVSVAGTRFWDTPEFNFVHCFENPYEPHPVNEKIYQRELSRLEMSLQKLDSKAKCRIAITHYPPIGTDLKPSAVSTLLEKYKVDFCLFGHLHGLKIDPVFGKKDGVEYILTAADYLDFKPRIIFEC